DARLPAYTGTAAAADGTLSRAAGAGAADGPDQFPPAIHDADLAGSESAEDDDADAADFHDHADKLPGRTGIVLFFVEPAGSYPAIFPQPRIPTIHPGYMSNIDSIELAAASVEEATREALEQLGAREDEVAIEVLATPRAGVLGLGARQARVRVTRKSAAVAGAGGQAGSNPQVAQASPPAHREAAPEGRARVRENQRRGRNDVVARRPNPAATAGDNDDNQTGGI